jgi:hypothetical protein
MKTSPTKRSLDKMRSESWAVCVIEKWVPNSPQGFKGPLITRDAWGFGDLLAVRSNTQGATLVQTTSGPNAATRLEKMKSIPEAQTWLLAGNRIVIHSWLKRGGRDERKLWSCREIEVTLELLREPIKKEEPAPVTPELALT